MAHLLAITSSPNRQGVTTGLVDGFVLSARGGDYSEQSPARGMDQQTPYLKTVLGFIGLNDVTFISAEGVASGGDGIAVAHGAVKSTVAGLAA